MDESTKARRRWGWLTRVRPLELAMLLKWMLGVRRVGVEVEGLKLEIDPASNFGKRLLDDGGYEAGVSAAFRELLLPGQTFVDIGANEGWFSLLASRAVGPSGCVLACEPQERLWPVILRNAALNGMTNIRLLPFAIGRARGSGEIYLYPSLNTGASHLGRTKRRWERIQKTEILPIGAILDNQGIRCVDLMKIDVEGHEHEVLEGAGSHLGSTIKKVFVEIHPHPVAASGGSASGIAGLLEKKGYRPRRAGAEEIWELV